MEVVVAQNALYHAKVERLVTYAMLFFDATVCGPHPSLLVVFAQLSMILEFLDRCCLKRFGLEEIARCIQEVL